MRKLKSYIRLSKRKNSRKSVSRRKLSRRKNSRKPASPRKLSKRKTSRKPASPRKLSKRKTSSKYRKILGGETFENERYSNMSKEELLELLKNIYSYNLETGSLLTRVVEKDLIQNEEKNESPYRFFSYFRFPNKYDIPEKNIWASRKCNSQKCNYYEYKVINDIEIINIPYTIKTYRDITKGNRDLARILYYLAVKHYNDNNKISIVKSAINDLILATDPFDNLDNTQTSGNPDYILSKLFVDLGLNGWIRYEEELEDRQSDEVLLCSKIFNNLEQTRKIEAENYEDLKKQYEDLKKQY